jgi:hypothetical protein
MQKYGRPVAEVLNEIAARTGQQQLVVERVAQPGSSPDLPVKVAA